MVPARRARSFGPLDPPLTCYARMYDAIIVGAGPGGATAAAVLARAGLRPLLLDKDTFPRDKICGDAISGKSVDVMKRLGMMDAMAEPSNSGAGA